MARLDLPDNIDLAIRLVESHTQAQSRRLEMGWIGRIFGNAAEKPGNIAGFAIIGAFVGILILLFAAPRNDIAPTRELYTFFGGVITLALGYLFGRSSS